MTKDTFMDNVYDVDNTQCIWFVLELEYTIYLYTEIIARNLNGNLHSLRTHDIQCI